MTLKRYKPKTKGTAIPKKRRIQHGTKIELIKNKIGALL